MDDDPYDYEGLDDDVDQLAVYGFFIGCVASTLFWVLLAGLLWLVL